MTAGTGLNLVIRADASPRVGSGHVMRCLALAQACRDDGGKAVFLIPEGNPGLEETIRGEYFPVRHSVPSPIGDAEATLAAARGEGADWIVLDGYGFQGGFQRRLKDGGARILCLDDNGECAPYYADAILNQNLHASPGMYSGVKPPVKLLLGTSYALLRREFHGRPRAGRDAAAPVRRLLVTMGGGDPDNVTEKVMFALRILHLRGATARFVIGFVNPHADSLAAQAAEALSPVCEIIRGSRDMPGLMDWADLAICAGGGTVWELLHMGVPMLTIVTAPNQKEVARSLAAEGLATDLGWHADLDREFIANAVQGVMADAETRAQRSARGRELVDGKGARRVLQALRAGGKRS